MKTIKKLSFLALLVAALAFAIGSSAMAFHDATNLVCNKCHTMHYSEDGAAPDMPDANGGLGLTEGGPNPHLLYYSNVSDLCLACHSGTAGQTIGSETAWSVWGRTTDTPGGDFQESDGTGNTINGHNPYGNGTNSSQLIDPDAVMPLTPPGNSAVAMDNWKCTSCHDEHGDSSEAFDYRNLKKVIVINSTTSVDVSGTIGSGNTQEANLGASYGTTNHNVYWNGTDGADSATKFGAWCGGCHGNFHGDDSDTTVNNGTDWIRHPTAYALGTTIATNYTSTYDPNIPVVSPQADTWTTGTVTVSSNEEVFCLSCHQTHATVNPNLMRWDSDEAAGASGRCNKCHKKGA